MSAPGALSTETALAFVNGHLGIQARITDRGNEVKCCVPDPEEGGCCKAYLNATECDELARGFAALAATLRVSEEPKP